MRALVIVLDSVGCGGAADAALYGDEGANTLGHLFEREQLELPHLASLGLYDLLRARGVNAPLTPMMRSGAAANYMAEKSVGKDTTTGHWEMSGIILDRPFETFDAFSQSLVGEIESRSNVSFIGNLAASGTEILARLGVQHVASGRPILYTSADSVLQIAAHEDPTIFGLQRLLELCQIARQVLDEQKILVGRVIARPFVGDNPDNFQRTGNRRDFSLTPPDNVLVEMQRSGINVIGVGKISDIFAGKGLTESHSTKSNAEGMTKIAALWNRSDPGAQFIFANLVDFDSLYGHRRNPRGYAQALREFDDWLGRFLPLVEPGDFLCITADHGNDPYHRGTDHTREQVPLLTLNSPVPPWSGDDFTEVAQLLRHYFSSWTRSGRGLPDHVK
jgi:phosphopentomutase